MRTFAVRKAMKTFVDTIRTFIRQHHLLGDGDRLQVCVSGGADSVALLRVMTALGYPLRAVHCNFHLRGDESDRDEAFVRNLCREQGVELDVVHFDTAAYAAAHKISIEMAAREQRYETFERLRTEHSLDAVCVGHHAEDSAETILLNLIRGTGIDGLTGISPRNGTIVRPLLGVTRSDIVAYLTALGQPWVDDSSNATDDYARNRIRHRLLPLMEEVNPAALQNILTTARNLRGTADLLNGEATDDAAVTLLHRHLAPHGYNATQVRNLLETLHRHSQTLIPARPAKDADGGCELEFRVVPYDPATMPRSADTLCLDVRRLNAPLRLRRWREGDRFCPFGMGGHSKLVSDLLTDHRLTRAQRSRQQVLCIGDDIAWVVGLRSDERFRIPPDASEILIVKVLF